jgi:tetratricopeptide (TPR) repeat protein
VLFCIASQAAAVQLPSGPLATAQLSSKDPLPPSATNSEKPTAAAASAAMEAGLRRDLEVHPNSAPLLYKLGEVLRLENKPKDSLEVYTQAAGLQKPNASQLRSVALDYVLLDDFNDAIYWLQVGAAMEPENADVHYSLGRCLYSTSRYPEAEAAFLRVLQIKPDHLKAEENLGLIYDYANQPEKAEAALRKAVEWAGPDSKDEWPFLDLGSFLLDHDRAAEAVPFLRRGAAINAACTACHEKLGRALVATGDAHGGVKELEISAHLDPKNAKMHFELGRAYRAVGELEKSRAEFALSQSLYGQHSRD